MSIKNKIIIAVIEIALIITAIIFDIYFFIPVLFLFAFLIFGINHKINIFILIFLMSINDSLPGISLGNFSVSAIQIVILISYFYLFVEISINGKSDFKKLKNIFFYLILAFIFLCFISIFQASNKIQSIRYLRDLISWNLVAIYIIYHIVSFEDYKYVLNVWIIAACFVSVLAFVQLFFVLDYFQIFQGKFNYILNTNIFRLNSTFKDPNFLANFLIVPFIISLSRGWFEKIKSHMIYASIIFIIILLTFSRGAIVSVIVGIIGIYFFNNTASKFFFKMILSVSLLVTFLLLILQILPESMFKRYSPFAGEADWSSITRTFYILIGIKIILGNFLFGVGINNFPIMFEKYTPDVIFQSLTRGGQEGVLHGGGYAHNTFLTIWAETGFFNAIVMIFIVIFALKLLFKIKNNMTLKRSEKSIAIGSIVGFLVIVLHIMTITHLAYHTFLSLALIIFLSKWITNEIKK